MRLNSTEVVEQRTLAQKDDAGVHMVVPAGTTGTTLELPVRQRLPSLPSTESELEQHSQLTSAALHGREWRRPLGGELKINTLT